MVSRGREGEADAILCFATQGDEHIEAERIRGLLEPLAARGVPVRALGEGPLGAAAARARARGAPGADRDGGKRHAGGLDAARRSTRCSGIPFIVSSGDAVGPFLHAALAPGGHARRRVRAPAAAGAAPGFVGWTPYLVGRALTFGAPRAMTRARAGRAATPPRARASGFASGWDRPASARRGTRGLAALERPRRLRLRRRARAGDPDGRAPRTWWR